MKIKTKLIIGLSLFPILLLLLVGLVWFQLAGIQKMNETTQAGYDLALLAEEIHIGIKNEAISMRNLVFWENQDTLDAELTLLEMESDEVTQNIAKLASEVDSSEQEGMIEELTSINKRFNRYKAELISLINQGKREEAIVLINSNGHPIQEEFFTAISGITDYFTVNMKTSLQSFEEDFEQKLRVGSLFALLVIAVLLGVVSRIIWTLVKRLNHVSRVMGSVAKGSADISTRVEIQSNDELDEMATSFNKMLSSLEEQMEKEQNLLWSKSNIADVTTSLYGKHDLESLSRTLLSKLVPLTESGHGVLYVKDLNQEKGKEPVYRLLASYGFKERKNISTIVAPGESLVGQAILEKTPILLTDVPSDYVSIHSGLGKARPLNLYILPILFEDDVKAVLEVASFKPFTETQQAFLEEMTSGLGIILESVMGRIQLAKLLEETQVLMEEIQAQSEELQSQQEELRVTNEELEEQTQALRQSEEKLQVQQEELEQANEELIEKASRLEEQNKMFELTNREVESARAALEEKARQLAISSKYKSEFLANMSHELRTPLNSLLILSRLLSDNPEGNLTTKQIEYAHTIYSSGQDLLILINDILDLTKIESGKMEVVNGKVSINGLTRFAEQRFRPIANEKGLDFDLLVGKKTPEFIYSDEQRIKQVLKNLLSNAFKFTHHGGVTLEISYNQGFAFSVVDTGVGIPKEKQALIFEAFQQADGTTSRRYGGTGLGLSISREISNLLGGEIIVESDEGRGSRFTFLVKGEQGSPAEPFFDEVAATKEETDVEQEAELVLEQKRDTHELFQVDPLEPNAEIKRLLIVDDDVKQRTSLMELIGGMDVIIKAVSTGREAMEQLKVNPFDGLVLDLGLADTNGFSLLEQMKSYITNEKIRVFIYTGRDLTSKEEIYLNRYAHTIIIKDSHSPQRLVEELQLFLDYDAEKEKNKGRDVEPIKPLSNLKGKKVLLVDDDVRNIYAISGILELHEMDIVYTENGAESLELVEKDTAIDIVLMDIMMPEMDGYEAIRRIRANPQFKHLPIIALTAKAMKEDREKCLEAGASDYIAKPVDPEKLVSLLAVWLHRQEGN